MVGERDRQNSADRCEDCKDTDKMFTKYGCGKRKADSDRLKTATNGMDRLLHRITKADRFLTGLSLRKLCRYTVYFKVNEITKYRCSDSVTEMAGSTASCGVVNGL